MHCGEIRSAHECRAHLAPALGRKRVGMPLPAMLRDLAAHTDPARLISRFTGAIPTAGRAE